MEFLNNFTPVKSKRNPVVALTQEYTYDGTQMLLLEDYPKMGMYTVATSWHCSCVHDFQSWDATAFLYCELMKVVEGWEKSGEDIERLFAQAVRLYFSYNPDWECQFCKCRGNPDWEQCEYARTLR